MKRLQVLFGEIEERCRSIASKHGPWPCGEGCDTCCRRLGQPPELTEPEWRLFREGLATLPPQRRDGILRRALTLQPNPDGTYVCPVLDRTRGACSLYEHRPAACRTYGFYVGREGERYCSIVADHVSHRDDDVVWGNQPAVDRQLERDGGPPRPVAHWIGEDEA